MIKPLCYKNTAFLCLVPGSSHICFGELSSSAQQFHQLPSRPRKPLSPPTRPAPTAGLAVKPTIHFETLSTLTQRPLSYTLPYPSAVETFNFNFALNPEGHRTGWRVSVMYYVTARRMTYYYKKHYCEYSEIVCGGDSIFPILFIVNSCKYQLSKLLGFTSRPLLVSMLAGLGCF